MSSEGWIKISRGINEHWIWKDPIKFQWWLDMLITVNFKDGKVNIGNQLIDCKRGQSVLSLQSWGLRWKVDKNKVRNFFVLLENDGMITHENLLKTTRITICKYESYQGFENAIKTQSKRNQNAIKTQPNAIEESKESKESKEGKNILLKKETKFNITDFLEFQGADKKLATEWIEVRKLKKLANTQTAMDDFIHEVEKSNMNINDVLKKCIVKSWGGFKYSWLIKEAQEQTQIIPKKNHNIFVPGEKIQ